GEPRHDRQMRGDLRGVDVVLEQLTHPLVELCPRCRDPIAGEYSARLPDDLGEGPVGGPLAIGEGAAAQEAPAVLTDAPRELESKPCLADPRGADDGYQVRLALHGRSRPGSSEQLELCRAPHEGGARYAAL